MSESEKPCLQLVQPNCDAEIVQLLEEWLGMARMGKLKAIAMVGVVSKSARTMSRRIPQGHFADINLGLDLLKQATVNDILENMKKGNE